MGQPTDGSEKGNPVAFSNDAGVTLNCLASGDPEPRVTWRRLNQQDVHNIPGVREVSLV